MVFPCFICFDLPMTLLLLPYLYAAFFPALRCNIRTVLLPRNIQHIPGQSMHLHASVCPLSRLCSLQTLTVRSGFL